MNNKKERFGLYGLAISRLEECSKINNQLISFPTVFEKLCRSFSIKKVEAWEILFILRDFGIIELIPFHGIKMKNRLK